MSGARVRLDYRNGQLVPQHDLNEMSQRFFLHGDLAEVVLTRPGTTLNRAISEEALKRLRFQTDPR